MCQHTHDLAETLENLGKSFVPAYLLLVVFAKSYEFVTGHSHAHEHTHDHVHDPGVSSVSIVCDGALDLDKVCSKNCNWWRRN